MSSRQIHIAAAIVAACSAIGGVGDKILNIPGLPSWFANAWGVLLAVSVLVVTVGHAIWPVIAPGVPLPPAPATTPAGPLSGPGLANVTPKP
jgi:hypothetical protein